jgi:hypothetical protein
MRSIFQKKKIMIYFPFQDCYPDCEMIECISIKDFEYHKKIEYAVKFFIAKKLIDCHNYWKIGKT